MPRPTSSSSTPSLLPSALPKDASHASPAPELPPPCALAPLAPVTNTELRLHPPTYAASHPPTPAAPAPARPFAPFFTLVTDVRGASTHHPRVHYLFSDDDRELVADAVLSLHDAQHVSARGTAATTSASGREAPAHGGRVERYVVVELEASGREVKGAWSLTGDWAVRATQVGVAPTLEGGGGGDGGQGSGEKGLLLLRIEGMEGWEEEDIAEGTGEGEGERERGLEELVEVFGKRMGELRGVVERRGMGGGAE